MTISEARANLAKAIRQAREQPVFLTNHGRRTAVLLDAKVYDWLVDEWEDYQDIIAYDQAKAEDDGTHMPWEEYEAEVRAELGLA
jgi:prevent-host-death family protein